MAEREELTRLRRQVRQLKMVRDILARATAGSAGKKGGRRPPLRTRDGEPGRLPVRNLCRVLKMASTLGRIDHRRSGRLTMRC